MKFVNDFKSFINKGNILQLAIGVAIGNAFNKIVTSLVNDVLMPPIGFILGGVDFSYLYLNLSPNTYPSLDAAKKAGAATINYGIFINEIIHFLIIGLSLFFIFRLFEFVNKKKEPEKTEPNEKECPFCLSNIPLKATRCSSCTSFVNEPATAD